MLDIAEDGLSRLVVWLQAGGLTGQLTDSLGLQLVLLAVSFLGVAFFTSAEAALVAVNKIRIQFLEGEGNAAAGVVNRVLAQHEKFFATILLSQNAFTISATAIGTALAAHLLQNAAYAALLTTVVMTVTISIFGEITPKTLAATYSERWSLVAGPSGGLRDAGLHAVHLSVHRASAPDVQGNGQRLLTDGRPDCLRANSA